MNSNWSLTRASNRNIGKYKVTKLIGNWARQSTRRTKMRYTRMMDKPTMIDNFYKLLTLIWLENSIKTNNILISAAAASGTLRMLLQSKTIDTKINRLRDRQRSRLNLRNKSKRKYLYRQFIIQNHTCRQWPQSQISKDQSAHIDRSTPREESTK